MTDSERLSEIIKSSKMSTKAFSEHIGLKTPQTLYDILKDRNGISKDVAKAIQAKCLHYNYAWILGGEGIKYKKNEDGITDSLINDEAESYNFPDVKIPQKDFSSLIETMNIQQKTIDRLTKTVEELTKKNDGTKGNGKSANSA